MKFISIVIALCFVSCGGPYPGGTNIPPREYIVKRISGEITLDANNYSFVKINTAIQNIQVLTVKSASTAV